MAHSGVPRGRALAVYARLIYTDETVDANATQKEQEAIMRHDEQAPRDGRVSISSSFVLQAQPTMLIARAREVQAICHHLLGEGTEAARLLTLTGPAGVGKTRLALAAGARLVDQFPDGVALVDLTPVREPEQILSAFARCLGVVESASQTLQEQLRNHLCKRELLLVVDNFEQVQPAAGMLADLLGSCPGLTLLVTSRIPLQLRWEQVLRVPPLQVPDLTTALPPLEELARVPAVALFLARARARRADFAFTEANASLVAQLVAKLDGLPLALELAAARVGGLPLLTIVRRLGGHLGLLHWEAPDLPPRQRSLEAALSWSYDLLSESEQRLFRCLGVFAGRASVSALAAVARAIETTAIAARAEEAEHAEDVAYRADSERILEGLSTLTEQSLALPSPSARQYGEYGEYNAEDDDAESAVAVMETIREYAWELLARNGELAIARRAHAHYFLALAERADPQLRGHGQRSWYIRLEHELDNLHAALHWLFDHEVSAERENGLQLAGALGWFWMMCGYPAEALRWLDEALACMQQRGPAEAAPDAVARARALLGLGPLLAQRKDCEPARAALEEALSLARQPGMAPADLARALMYLGGHALVSREWTKSTRLLREALGRWEKVGDAHFIGLTLWLLGMVAFGQGGYAEAATIETRALNEFAAAGDLRMVSRVHFTFAAIERARGNLSHAARHLHTGLQIGAKLQSRPHITLGTRATVSLTCVMGQWADPAQAARLLGAVDVLGQSMDATFATLESRRADQDVEDMQDRLEREGWGAAFREGRLLPYAQVAALALAALEEFMQRLATPGILASAFEKSAARQKTSHESSGRLEGPNAVLTERELEVLRLLAAGQSNAEIADSLVVAIGTVKAHIQHIYRKVDAHSRTHALARARDLGLLDNFPRHTMAFAVIP
jgi:predicted ATPase/DNA-binding CsgD family transcriptional regulator